LENTTATEQTIKHFDMAVSGLGFIRFVNLKCAVLNSHLFGEHKI